MTVSKQLSLDPDVLSAITEEEVQGHPDQLKQVRSKAAQAANLQLDIVDLEEQLAEAKSRLNRILSEDLPKIMSAAGMSDFTLDGLGNMPSRKFFLKPFFSANIPKDWDDNRRYQAFSALEDHDGAWLIKHRVEVNFPQGSRDEAREFIDHLAHQGHSYTVKESVHHGQMAKWLKERVTKKLPIPPLDVIGASMGQVAVIKEVE